MCASPGPEEPGPPLQGVRPDSSTRRAMLEELDQDIAEHRLYLSPLLSERGRADFEPLLRAAIELGTDASLADELAACERVIPPRRWQKPGVERTLTARRVETATALAQDELHRFYARGLCQRALARGLHTLVIYRAKPATSARVSSDAMVGVRIDAASLLDDLRASPDLRRPSGLPAYRHSGLSVRLP
jgi:hypothetical protein